MKVGIIGLGRMGEGMSRRMIKEGIEVYGYRRNYVKAQEAVKSGYITDAADSLERPCSSSQKQKEYLRGEIW
jgi:6-phosphogluconate dehydrogenase